MKISAKSFKRLKSRKTLKITGAILAVFVLINVALALSFSNHTYPSQKIGSKSVGSIAYAKLPSKINQLGLLPKKVVLSAHGQTYTYSANALGIEPNTTIIIHKTEHKSWLPVINLFQSNNVAFVETVNSTKLNTVLTALSNTSKQNPVNASVILTNSEFTLSPAQNGYQIDLSSALSEISNAISEGKDAVSLSVATLPPAITNTVATKTLDQLTQAEKDSLSYSYQSSKTSPSPSVVASWYSLSGTTYSLSNGLISTYIKEIGSKNNITVANLTDAVSATVTALNDDKSLSFTLQAVPPSSCSSNQLSKLILVSISQRHLWACNGYSVAYDSPVVTGIDYLAADLTPTGTYHIYAKLTNQVLTGSDSTGSWHDAVSYWMPFLDNQYGEYGLHDATWRAPTDFGNISPDSANASHGCVELPLATAAWIFGWASIGTTVTIQQ